MVTERILVVDHDQDIVGTLREILEVNGRRVVTASTAREAERVDGEFGIAILEVSLPDDSGIDLARRLRGRQPDLDLIFLSTGSSASRVMDAMALGATRFLRKPCEPALLIQLVTDVLQKRDLLRQARRQARRFRIMNDLLHQLIGTLDPDELAEIGSAALTRTCQARAVAILSTMEEPREGQRPRLWWVHGDPRPALVERLTSGRWTPAQPADDNLDLLVVRETPALTRCCGRRFPCGRKIWVLIEQPEDPCDPELLELMVAQLTGALHQALLHQDLHASYELQRAAQHTLIQTERQSAVGRISAGIAHEIGTPLGIISLRAEMLLNKAPEGSRDAQSLNVILAQAERISLLVRQLLAYARAEPVGGERQRLTIKGVLDETLPLLSSRARKLNVTIHTRVAPDTPELVGSFHLLQQVCFNLLINTFDAHAHEVTVSAGPADGQVLLTFSDDGEGIATDDLERVFDPFYTTRKPGVGTGLGLAVVRRIVEDHGGRVWAERANPGTHLHVALPAASSAD